MSTLLSYFKNHLSIKSIKENYDNSTEKLSFLPVLLENLENIIKSLEIKKSTLSESIPASFLKAHSNAYHNK